jgi:hypothetical protein
MGSGPLNTEKSGGGRESRVRQSTMIPPPPDVTAASPDVQQAVDVSDSWRLLVELTVKTVRPGRAASYSSAPPENA